jgi:hypothetical protein
MPHTAGQRIGWTGAEARELVDSLLSENAYPHPVEAFTPMRHPTDAGLR